MTLDMNYRLNDALSKKLETFMKCETCKHFVRGEKPYHKVGICHADKSSKNYKVLPKVYATGKCAKHRFSQEFKDTLTKKEETNGKKTTKKT